VESLGLPVGSSGATNQQGIINPGYLVAGGAAIQRQAIYVFPVFVLFSPVRGCTLWLAVNDSKEEYLFPA
jgi:hypothetical protein